MERKLRIANHQVTGSRLGFIRPGLTVRPFNGPLAGQTITAELYYKHEYWRTNRYLEWKDKMWHAPDRTGHVDVGEVKKDQEKAEPDTLFPMPQPHTSPEPPVHPPARPPNRRHTT